MMQEYLDEVNNFLEACGIKKVNSIPSSIYKYYNFKCNYSLENLKKGVVWFNSASHFNDLYDCCFFLDSTKMKKYTESKNKRSIFEENYNFIQHMQKITLVSCFSESDITTNMLMWGHYADHHRGFCVEYDMKELILNSRSKQEVTLFPVIYDCRKADLTDNLISLKDYQELDIDELSELEVAKCSFKTVLIKYKQWEYEQEWRLIPKNVVGPDGRTFLMPKPKAVYLGTNIKPENKEQIKQIAQKKDITIYQMKFSDKDRYELDYTEL